ncbi:hypothetical protein GN958_ATG20996 [Phytophthora infestans]|uniref:Uncharacterized protein n=1 Tax=Phytophthora infestans TaxID=4787 RepID=A0A8S9TMZ2_PHYIN|nr:hypothetical protein GN958_ATG20996 [Phytophthora infestans]
MLMRKSVFSYYAFTQYFETAPASEKGVWTNISSDDWTLIIEMEAVTDQLAQFSLSDVEKEGDASSHDDLDPNDLIMCSKICSSVYVLSSRRTKVLGPSSRRASLTMVNDAEVQYVTWNRPRRRSAKVD